MRNVEAVILLSGPGEILIEISGRKQYRVIVEDGVLVSIDEKMPRETRFYRTTILAPGDSYQLRGPDGLPLGLVIENEDDSPHVDKHIPRISSQEF